MMLRFSSAIFILITFVVLGCSPRDPAVLKPGEGKSPGRPAGASTNGSPSTPSLMPDNAEILMSSYAITRSADLSRWITLSQQLLGVSTSFGVPTKDCVKLKLEKDSANEQEWKVSYRKCNFTSATGVAFSLKGRQTLKIQTNANRELLGLSVVNDEPTSPTSMVLSLRSVNGKSDITNTFVETLGLKISALADGSGFEVKEYCNRWTLVRSTKDIVGQLDFQMLGGRILWTAEKNLKFVGAVNAVADFKAATAGLSGSYEMDLEADAQNTPVWSSQFSPLRQGEWQSSSGAKVSDQGAQIQLKNAAGVTTLPVESNTNVADDTLGSYPFSWVVIQRLMKLEAL